MNMLSRIFVLAIATSSLLFPFSQLGIGSHLSKRDLAYPRLKPGEKIGEMIITTGAEDAFPLWSICGPIRVTGNSIKADCGELSHEKLVIGHTLGVMDLVAPSIEWEDLNWEISVNGHPIDLAAFGVYDFVQIFHPSHSGREVFRVSKVWNIVLVNPAPGMHRLQGQAQSQDGAETYTWVVDFTVTTPLSLVKGGKN